jgi:hypothetical protein
MVLYPSVCLPALHTAAVDKDHTRAMAPAPASMALVELPVPLLWAAHVHHIPHLVAIPCRWVSAAVLSLLMSQLKQLRVEQWHTLSKAASARRPYDAWSKVASNS